MQRSRYAMAVGFGLVLVLNLPLANGGSQETLLATAMAPVAEALRERVAHDGWVRVRVGLRQPQDALAPGDAVQSDIRQDDLDRTVQDLLFALPPGSSSFKVFTISCNLSILLRFLEGSA
jgi:hypothetical protein